MQLKIIKDAIEHKRDQLIVMATGKGLRKFVQAYFM